MTGQTPTVGRIVHYTSYGSPMRADGTQAFQSLCRAAIITEVGDDPDGPIGLCAINPTGMFFHSIADGGCEYDDAPERAGGTWHWPERV